ncbi:glutamate ligase domain-containing protein [Croceibacterium ferulae]|uniref:glutamate ligase domain-containing protein n=1 Tax=Croceibacterium ferulae TaxID=1854641 RepID=UPI000EAF0042|nr:Mur ligase family protein [Croceibacterium ferulae]
MTDAPIADLTAQPWFFCGIGGSGMLPLALILRQQGADVAGSDRSFDQGRADAKRDWLAALGFGLHPQDGSGIISPAQVLVASAAIEDSVPEVARAAALGCRRMSRAQLLSTLFNAASCGIAVGGTSGKSTVTGMLGWILHDTGREPTIVNGAVMKNFVQPGLPFASAIAGGGEAFVAEVDESDGSIALYDPAVAVLLNVSLDHKSIEELRVLFGNFIGRAGTAVLNMDDEEVAWLAEHVPAALTFGVDNPAAAIGIEPGTIEESATGIAALVVDRREDVAHALRLNVPGRHNLSNALAAIAGAAAGGVPLHEATLALSTFIGLARRFDVLGSSSGGITVIDDFGHNPEKCAATLRTLKAHPGRVIAFFQPHGYGPLRQMGQELAATFASELGPDDLTIMCDPVYFGGTVDRSQGTEQVVARINELGGHAEHLASRDACGERIVALARPGDRIVVMGARDDTLTGFARSLLDRLP